MDDSCRQPTYYHINICDGLPEVSADPVEQPMRSGLEVDVDRMLGTGIGAKPNLYCEAIELVCGGSPKICVPVERKTRLRAK